MSQVETTSAGVLPSRAPSWMNKSHCKNHKSKHKKNKYRANGFSSILLKETLRQDPTPKESGILMTEQLGCLLLVCPHTRAALLQLF